MEVWGFVGSSGTGKSHRALEVAKKKGLSCIIDDGLLIRGQSILAGKSAKREPSRLASVRRALFMEPEHSAEVKKAIADFGVDSLLILGTSNQMIEAIVKRLDVPSVAGYVYIQDVASPEEIDMAVHIRKSEGKHVIPVPTVAVKKEFSGYFLDPLKRLPINRKKARENKTVKGAAASREMGERTVVRPTFSYLGSFTISRTAVDQLIGIAAMKVPNVAGIVAIKSDYSSAGIHLDVQLAIQYGCKIHNVLQQALDNIKIEVEKQTALNLLGVDVTAKALAIAI